MKSLIQNKKGSVQDIFLIIIMLIVFAIFFVIIMIVQDKINTAASPAFENVSAGSSIGITTVSSIFNNTLNYMYLAVFFALIIGTFIMAYMTPTHPIFYLLAIILFIGLMLVSVVISNTWQVFSTANADIVTQVGHLSFADYILKNLPLVSIVIGVLVAIVLFARSNNQGNIGGGFQ